MNPFYSAMNQQNPMQMLNALKSNPFNIPQNIVNDLNALKSNPVQFLMQRKLNIPQDMANDPNKIINHLVSSGQVPQSAYDRTRQIAQQMGMK